MPDSSITFTLIPEDNTRLALLCGSYDHNIQTISDQFEVGITNRSNEFTITGPRKKLTRVKSLIEDLYITAATGVLDPEDVHLSIQEALHRNKGDSLHEVSIKTRRKQVHARGDNQKRYILQIQTRDLNFGIGPAGTGKTYLAVACAVDALDSGHVRRIVLVRPAVEAGERLGFLPGNMADKIDPYLRPMYDALYELLGFEKVERLMEKNVIEVAPLAFMRGRTLNESFVILDEAQNTTREQMKMFLTRIGYGSRAVVTGDVTQTDLPKHTKSGLLEALVVLKDEDTVGITHFESLDVVRHPLVQRVVNAYARHQAMQDDKI
ncbi:MAG: PhoH family protein [Gammaproteobacteria bacterium]|nr:PhoH family protein [Gammaproteobacteria bacterium]